MEEELRKRKRRTIIIAASAFVGLVVLIALIQNHGNSRQGHDARSYDPYSGETVSTLNGQTPENSGAGDPGPLYLGFSTLLQHGFTDNDVATIQAAYEAYSTSAKLKVTEVSLDVSSYKSSDESKSDDGTAVTSFTVVFNRKELYRTELEPVSLDTLKVLLYDKSGKLVSSYPTEDQSEQNVEVDPG